MTQQSKPPHPAAEPPWGHGDAEPPCQQAIAAKDGLVETFLFGLSLPERTLRSASALIGGLVHESSARLLPAAFRTSKSYSVFVDQSINFLTQDVGGVRSKGAAEGNAAQGEEAFLARKAVGGLLDVAGMATLHLSPITLLAIISDVAHGSSTYVRQLADELKRQGVIDPESTVDHVSDLLAALKSTSGQMADSLDTPPINVQGLRQTIEQTQASLSGLDPARVLPQAEIARLWQEMETMAGRSDATLLDVSTTVTMFAMNRLNLATRGALSTVTVAGNLMDQHIFQHYTDALVQIRREGLYETLATASTPYVEAVWHNFDVERETWTQEILTGRLLGKTWMQVRSWWGGEEVKRADEEREGEAEGIPEGKS